MLRIVEDLRPMARTAESVRSMIQQIYSYAIQKLLVEVNPASPLRGVIQVPPANHHRHLRERELGAFWRAVEKQGAHFVTIAATKMLVYTMCRKSEVLRAQWSEFDLEDAIWEIPASRMKMRQVHRVYLSRQAVDVLKLLRSITQGTAGYVFASALRRSVPIADATLNHFFKRLDFGDWIGAGGRLFRTKTKELTIWASRLHFLSKCLLPLPEKWHGLTDVEIRYRQRYLDLIVNPDSRRV
ncbi:MAG: tyrosine-type recombinase/integrase, partial [Planctomycetota bacterium]